MEKTITLYNHWTKFKDSMYINEESSYWTPNRKLAEQRMAEDIAYLNSDVRYEGPVDYGIVEKECSNEVVLVGELGDNNDPYNFHITVGRTSLRDALLDKYRGCNVKLTMEILP